jgi:RNA polymerase sigma-70 factor, ECF subfamily
MVGARRCRSDSGSVRTTHVHLAGRAEPPPLADEDLVERARTDPDAFAELYRRYVNRVHAFVYRRSRSTELADEITSATFERALRALPGFRWREGGFQAWIYRIAANELASHYRRAQRQQSERGQRAARQLHEDSTADDLPLDDGDGEVVLQALSRLNERYQRAITLRYLAGLSPEDAARAMGLNKATLAVVLHRALGALRRAMNELERDARRSWPVDGGAAR